MDQGRSGRGGRQALSPDQPAVALPHQDQFIDASIEQQQSQDIERNRLRGKRGIGPDHAPPLDDPRQAVCGETAILGHREDVGATGDRVGSRSRLTHQVQRGQGHSCRQFRGVGRLIQCRPRAQFSFRIQRLLQARLQGFVPFQIGIFQQEFATRVECREWGILFEILVNLSQRCLKCFVLANRGFGLLDRRVDVLQGLRGGLVDRAVLLQ